MYAYTDMCVRTQVYLSMFARMYACTYTYIYICICICMCAYIYMCIPCLYNFGSNLSRVCTVLALQHGLPGYREAAEGKTRPALFARASSGWVLI